jgi:hypothetical protein
MAHTTDSKVGYDYLPIGKVLANSRLFVQPHQREYAWTTDEVTELFRDFADAIRTGKDTYFLGTLVLTRGEERDTFDVIDGQQRLATATILLAAIRDVLYGRPAAQLIVQSVTNFLYRIDRAKNDIIETLSLNVEDNEYFRGTIIAPPDKRRNLKPHRPSNKLLRNAAQLAAEHVQSIISTVSESKWHEALNQWVDFVEQNATVMVFSLPTYDAAYDMFETLNDRGLDVNQADLLKNYLFKFAGSRVKEAQQKWATMKATVESLATEEIVLAYLRHYTISRYGFTRDKKVYKKIQDNVAGRPQAMDFLEALADDSVGYVAIVTPDHSRWNQYHPDIREYIKAISTMKVVSLRPIMLSVAITFPPTEAVKAFRLLVAWAVRFLIVGGGRSGSVEEGYADVAYKVRTEQIKTAKKLAESAVDLVPKDSEFEAAFATARVSQAYLARYYLRALELQKQGESDPEKIPNENTVINLEHVMPQNPGPDWSHIPRETADAYYKRLGNLVLLQAKKNSLIANSGFSVKAPILAASTYQLTKEVGKETGWGPAQIDARQKRLAKLAVQTWPLTVR